MDGFLSTSGNQIVDGAGQPVKISGVNWFGLESTRYAPDGLHARSYQSMMDQMAELGFNTIRLPYSDELFLNGLPTGIDFGLNPDLVGLTGLEILDEIVAYAGRIGLRIILDHHRNDAGDGASANGLWYNGEYGENQWIANWKALAARYADNPTVIGADLHNEPHADATWGGGGLNDWAAAAERAGNAIHQVNPNWLIFVEGVETYAGEASWWGGNLMGVENRPIVLAVAQKLVYSAHEYPNSIFPQPWFDDPSFPANLAARFDRMWGYIYKDGLAPVYLGEFGSRLADPKDEAWLTSLKAYLSGDIPQGSEGIGWTWWSWNPNSGDTGGILTDDWSGVELRKMGEIGPLLWPGEFPGVHVGTAGADGLIGSFRHDLMWGHDGADTLRGGGGNDTIDGGSGADVMHGGAGDDVYRVDNGEDAVVEGSGDGFDTVLSVANFALAAGSSIERLQAAEAAGLAALILIGNDEANAITGNAGGNTLEGRGGLDYLRGLAGNDTLDGGGGADTLEGGSGDDVFMVDHKEDRVFETADGGHDTVRAAVSFALAADSHVEELRASSGAFAIALTGNALGNLVTGTSGGDTLDGAGGADTLVGGTGDDFYLVDDAFDFIVEEAGGGTETVFASTSFALAGNLEILKAVAGEPGLNLIGNALANEIVGNVGANGIYGVDGDDRLYGDGGNDGLYGGGGRDLLFGGIGDDLLEGGADEDSLYADVGDDRLSGGEGNDVLFGGAGNDAILGDAAVDTLYGDEGNDALYGGSGNDLIYGGVGLNRLYGGDGNDKVFGGAHADTIYGDVGNDSLKGDAGNDHLYGGLGNDSLSGSYGRDGFVFNTRPHSRSNVDRISDFKVVDDTIKLARSVFTKVGPKGYLKADAFWTGSSAHDASDRVIYNKAAGTLSYDPDGTGGAALIRYAIVKKYLPLTHMDFLIV
jgi:Ca2+-binding RTX toxin-like protein/aryl-phospho-beta-D-glucosidase BglC (GH1 family)